MAFVLTEEVYGLSCPGLLRWTFVCDRSGSYLRNLLHNFGTDEMKTWSVRRENLLAAIRVLDLVPTRLGIPSSEFIRVEGRQGRLQCVISGEITGSVELRGDGEWPLKRVFYLDRRVFLPFVYAAKEIKNKAPFVFKLSGGSGVGKQLEVIHGRRKARFSTQSEIAGYGFPPKGGKEIGQLQLAGHVRGLIYCARECSTADPVTPELNCVYVSPNGRGTDIFATNQKIVYQAHSSAGVGSPIPVPFPLFLVSLLGSEELKAVHWREKYVSIEFKGGGEIWQAVSAKARTGFPVKDIKKYAKLSKDEPVLFMVQSRRMSKVLIRLCNYLQAVRRQDWLLNIRGQKDGNEVVLESNIPQTNFRERLPVLRPLKKSFTLDWPLDMLQPVFEFIGKENKKVGMIVRQGEKGPSYVETGDILLAIPRKKNG